MTLLIFIKILSLSNFVHYYTLLQFKTPISHQGVTDTLILKTISASAATVN